MMMATGPSPDCFHAVRFYQDGEALARQVADFIAQGIRTSSPAVVIATPPHREAILDALRWRAFDVERLQSAGRLRLVDAGDMLNSITTGGVPDVERFRASATPVIDAAIGGRDDVTVYAYGEMVDLLWRSGQTAAALRLEALWQELTESYRLALLCGYSMKHVSDSSAHVEVSRLHTHLLSDSGSLVAVPSSRRPSGLDPR